PFSSKPHSAIRSPALAGPGAAARLTSTMMAFPMCILPTACKPNSRCATMNQSSGCTIYLWMRPSMTRPRRVISWKKQAVPEVWPEEKQTLQISKNTLPDSGHWIGFRFREEGNGKSPVGARVTVYYNGRSATRQLVTGDSHRSQHPNTVHFGLAQAERVNRVE